MGADGRACESEERAGKGNRSNSKVQIPRKVQGVNGGKQGGGRGTVQTPRLKFQGRFKELMEENREGEGELLKHQGSNSKEGSRS
jgi:hypothetical protein